MKTLFPNLSDLDGWKRLEGEWLGAGGGVGFGGVLEDVPLYIQMALLILAVVESEREQLGLQSATTELQCLSFHSFSQNIRVELT